MAGKIAVIGERESIAAFKAIGIDTYEAQAGADIGGLLADLAGSGYDTVFITENVCGRIEDSAEPVEKSIGQRKPAITVIPGKTQNIGTGIENLRRMVEKAVGADVLSN